MDDHLRQLIAELFQAINDAVSESKSVNTIIKKIGERGYDVYIMMDANIGLKKLEDSSKPKPPQNPIHWTTQDRKFLRALKINGD
jgi:hypothetical protein